MALVETNRHHLWWQRRNFEAFKLSSEIRNHPLSIQVMTLPIHAELHHHVEPIAPPSAPVARMILQNIYKLNPRYTALDAAKSLEYSLQDTEAQEYADHLGKQIPFMELSVNAMKRRSV